MNQATTISTIIKSLKEAGIKDSEVIEEMVDHYLTEVESLTAQGISNQEATAKVVHLLQSSNLETLRSKSKPRWPFAIALMMLVALCYYYVISVTSETLIVETQSTVATLDTIPSGWPVACADARISSHFGMRFHPLARKKKLHKGIDFAVPTGTPILATGDGVVKDIGHKKKAGHYIILQHGSRYCTKYYHLSEITVEAGDTILRGDLIAKSGSSGMSMAPHLHYEIVDQSSAIDPMVFLES